MGLGEVVANFKSSYYLQVEVLGALDDIQGKVDLSSLSTEYQKLWYQIWMDLRY